MRTRNGRTHAYAIKHPYKGPIAPERQRTITAFKDAVNQTTVIFEHPRTPFRVGGEIRCLPQES